MAFLRQAYGRYYLDMSSEELNALVDVMEELPSMTKVERGIWYQIKTQGFPQTRGKMAQNRGGKARSLSRS